MQRGGIVPPPSRGERSSAGGTKKRADCVPSVGHANVRCSGSEPPCHSRHRGRASGVVGSASGRVMARGSRCHAKSESRSRTPPRNGALPRSFFGCSANFDRRCCNESCRWCSPGPDQRALDIVHNAGGFQLLVIRHFGPPRVGPGGRGRVGEYPGLASGNGFTRIDVLSEICPGIRDASH